MNKEQSRQERDNVWQILRPADNPNPKKEKEIKTYFLDTYKNNYHTIKPDFLPYPSILSEPSYIIYIFRQSSIFAMFLRDLRISAPETAKELKKIMRLNYQPNVILYTAKHGRPYPNQILRAVSFNVIGSVSYVLGYPDTFFFLSFLNDLYSIPYQRMMKGEGVKRGQPWFALNYEDGTSGQGPNSEEGPPI